MAMEENIIKFKDVSFQYQSDTAFTLDHVSFNIPKVNGRQLSVIMVQEINACKIDGRYRASK